MTCECECVVCVFSYGWTVGRWEICDLEKCVQRCLCALKIHSRNTLFFVTNRTLQCKTVKLQVIREHVKWKHVYAQLTHSIIIKPVSLSLALLFSLSFCLTPLLYNCIPNIYKLFLKYVVTILRESENICAYTNTYASHTHTVPHKCTDIQTIVKWCACAHSRFAKCSKPKKIS